MTVTWQALGSVALLLIGLGTLAYGVLATFAAGMSDTSGQGNDGCAPVLVGIVLCIGAILGFVL